MASGLYNYQFQLILLKSYKYIIYFYLGGEGGSDLIKKIVGIVIKENIKASKNIKLNIWFLLEFYEMNKGRITNPMPIPKGFKFVRI